MRETFIDDGDKFHIKYEEDVSHIIKANHEEMARKSVFDKKRDFHHVMRVPHIVLMEIQRQTGLDFFKPDDAKEIMKILKRPEYAKFRTAPGRI